jgi:hypothetical protein
MAIDLTEIIRLSISSFVGASPTDEWATIKFTITQVGLAPSSGFAVRELNARTKSGRIWCAGRADGNEERVRY